MKNHFSFLYFVLLAVATALFLFISCKKEQTTENQEPSIIDGGGSGEESESVLSLTPSTLVLTVGSTAQLTATLTPAVESAVFTWSSEPVTVAEVDDNGLVTAKADGQAVITVSALGKTASCEVTVSVPVHYNAVDLGLPSGLKWASCNIGASSPEEVGNYYSWGEVYPKSSYYMDYYKWSTRNGSDIVYTKYNEKDAKQVLSGSDDVAFFCLGDRWRMPINSEWEELRTNCVWRQTNRNGVEGYEVSGNGNVIFLPMTGQKIDSRIEHGDDYGCYWLSSLNENGFSTSVWLQRNAVSTSCPPRFYGLPVRAVYGDRPFEDEIVVNPDSLVILVGESVRLVATYVPTTKKFNFTWSSDNPAVVAVDGDGNITALSSGVANISVSANSLTAISKVNVKGTNTAEAIDMGLPSGLKWASWNVGASSPEEVGDFYAWGEVDRKETFSFENYKYCEGTMTSMIKYNESKSAGWFQDDKRKLDANDDVASVLWKDCWRIPTRKEWTELLDNCTWTVTTLGGVKGYDVAATNGNHLFFPFTGSSYTGSQYGRYWSSSLRYQDGVIGASSACYFSLSETQARISGQYKYFGSAVRPVTTGTTVPVASLTLNKESVVLEMGDLLLLVETISPSNATNPFMTWVSEDESVATVSDGRVLAVGVGTTTVTASAGGKSASCSITVSAVPEDAANGVDLGLPSKLRWASKNIGSDSEEGFGDYYAWGEIASKTYYQWSSYLWCEGTEASLIKYNSSADYGVVDNHAKLDAIDDVASVQWGGSWRMPVGAEWKELMNNCSFSWAYRNKVYGVRVAGTNGASIFLPCAGDKSGSAQEASRSCRYWSSIAGSTNGDASKGKMRANAAESRR